MSMIHTQDSHSHTGIIIPWNDHTDMIFDQYDGMILWNDPYFHGHLRTYVQVGHVIVALRSDCSM